MQDKIILGFMAHGDYTLYGLRKTMEIKTSMFYNTSTGSIHPALKKLLNAGMITCREVSEGRRVKKVYSRTDKGRDCFLEWIAEPMPQSKVKDEAILRLFFYGHLQGDVTTYLNDYIDELNQMVALLTPMLAQYENVPVPHDMAKAHFFEISTLKFGLDYIKFTRDWYEKLITDYNSKQFTD